MTTGVLLHGNPDCFWPAKCHNTDYVQISGSGVFVRFGWVDSAQLIIQHFCVFFFHMFSRDACYFVASGAMQNKKHAAVTNRPQFSFWHDHETINAVTK